MYVDNYIIFIFESDKQVLMGVDGQCGNVSFIYLYLYLECFNTDILRNSPAILKFDKDGIECILHEIKKWVS